MTNFNQLKMFGSNSGEASPINEMRIELVEPTAKKHRNTDRVLSVQKAGRIVIGDAGKRLIGVDVDDYVLMGQVGGNWYIGKRPAGSFKGYKIIKQQGKNANATYFQSQSLRPLTQGEYSLGTAVNQDGVAWHQLSRIE